MVEKDQPPSRQVESSTPRVPYHRRLCGRFCKTFLRVIRHPIRSFLSFIRVRLVGFLCVIGVLALTMGLVRAEAVHRDRAIRASEVRALSFGLHRGCERGNETRLATAAAITDIEIGLYSLDPDLSKAYFSHTPVPYAQGNPFDLARDQLATIDCDLYVKATLSTLKE